MNGLSKFETMARLGFAARGLMYVMIGYLALRYREATDAPGMLRSLQDSGMGQFALLLLAIGLFGYGVWRLIESSLDLDGRGDDAKGKAVRFAHMLSGTLHLGLGLYALYLMVRGTPDGGGESQGTEQATGIALGLPGGSVLVGVLGAALIAAGLYQFIHAWKLSFLKHLLPRAASKTWVHWVGRLGYAARGVVFGLVGAFLLEAARTGSENQAGGMDDALRWLSPEQMTVVAAGLALFGIFCFVEAIYRRITDQGVAARLTAAARSGKEAVSGGGGTHTR